MTRDYKNVTEAGAKQKTRSKVKPKAKARASSNASADKSLPGWLLLVSGVVIGGFISFIVYLKLNVPIDTDVTKDKQISTEVKKNHQSQSSSGKDIKKEDQSNEQLEFYKILPNREVTLPDVEKKNQNQNSLTNKTEEPEASSKQGKETYLYTLQVGSFLSFKDADKRKASLALIGIGSRIHAIKTQNITRYRVLVGPYDNITRINEINSQMKANNIKTLLLKERDRI